MAAQDLDFLYRLHKIDSAIVEIKLRAANLNPGNEERAAIKAFQPTYAAAKKAQEDGRAEIKDLELQQASLKDKLTKTDKLLYGGTVVNPREVENYEKEIANIKQKMSSNDDRLLALIDAQPTHEKRYEVAAGKAKVLKEAADAAYEKALNLKAQLETQFKQLTSERGQAAAKVSPGMLKQYDAIRARQGGIGMAELEDNGSCRRCGTVLPEKTVLGVREGRLITCESCHRILIQVIPSV